jgi:putative phosphoribosyl transferase
MEPNPGLPFADRATAGRVLAQAVERTAGDVDLILGLPRGGVAVGAEIATALGIPLDVFLVRKVGAPEQPELAMGALAETGHLELNQRVLNSIGLDQASLTALVRLERLEIERRLQSYRSGRPAPNVSGRHVLVVDDGIATGATMLVALRALRAQQPARLLMATPVCPTSTLARLQTEADQVIVLATPEPFGAVGSWYGDFHQMSDDEVTALLAKSGPGSRPSL